MTFQTEFPDFPVSDMPQIPPSFVDTSWHNDTCPCFTSDALGFTIWIDYADVSNREYENYSRFSVHSQSSGIETSGPSLETDDWQEVLTFLLSRQFVKTIQEWSTPEQLAKIRKRNAAEGVNSPICHTHDFYDANMAMDSAFNAVFGRGIESFDDETSQSDIDLWNAAWSKAKQESLS